MARCASFCAEHTTTQIP